MLIRAPMRARMRAGIEALADAELVAILLGTGRAGEPVQALAAALLDEHGGIGGLARLGTGAIAERKGIGAAKAARIAAAMELGRRAAAPPEALVFADSRAVEAWARPRLVALEHEELWVLALDGRLRMRGARRVAMGGLHGLHVTARDVLRAALRDGASTFILVHNHPSGDPTPSEEDVAATLAIARAAAVVETPLVDHVIVAREGVRSVEIRQRHVNPGGTMRRTRSGSRDSARAARAGTTRSSEPP
jgi:DNA repair protein RadC